MPSRRDGRQVGDSRAVRRERRGGDHLPADERGGRSHRQRGAVEGRRVRGEPRIEGPVIALDRGRRCVVRQLTELPAARREEVEVGEVVLPAHYHELARWTRRRLHPSVLGRDLRERTVLEPIHSHRLDHVDGPGQGRRGNLIRAVDYDVVGFEVPGGVVDTNAKGEHGQEKASADKPAHQGKFWWTRGRICPQSGNTTLWAAAHPSDV